MRLLAQALALAVLTSSPIAFATTPAAPAAAPAATTTAPHTYTVKVDGMHCAPCVQAVKEALAKIPGVDQQSLKVTLKKKEAVFTTATEDKDINAKIQAAIEDAGYTVSSVNGKKLETKKN